MYGQLLCKTNPHTKTLFRGPKANLSLAGTMELFSSPVSKIRIPVYKIGFPFPVSLDLNSKKIRMSQSKSDRVKRYKSMWSVLL